MLRRLLTQADGQGLVEYSLILVLVAVVVIMVLSLFGSAVGNMFSVVVDTLNPPPEDEPPPECYGSLLLPIMVGATGLGVWITQMLPGKLREQPAA